MIDLKSDNPEHKELIDVVDRLHDMYFRYRQRRFKSEMRPDFSGVRWYLGRKERQAIRLCARHIDVTVAPDGSLDESKLLDLPVHWVLADSHVALVESV